MVEPGNNTRQDFVIHRDGTEQAVEDLRREEYYGSSGDIFHKKTILPFIIGGVGLIVLVLVFAIILSGRDEGADRKTLQALETRIEQIEDKLASASANEQTLEQLARQERGLSTLGERFRGFESTVTTQIDQIIKELGTLHQKIDRPPVSKAQALPPAEKRAPAVAQKKTGNPEFYQVQAGDTLFRISRRYDLTVQQLQSYNNLAPNAAIYPGQKLKLRPNAKQ
ncbi:MAG: LysM peptidoglycan-binding domain-containing protein [Desulfobacterales bacterium]|jgi:LysM repeat protein